LSSNTGNRGSFDLQAFQARTPGSLESVKTGDTPVEMCPSKRMLYNPSHC